MGAALTSMRVTLSSSTSAPPLCSAFDTADHNTLYIRRAPFFGMNLSVCNALFTGLPRTTSATSRHFCGLMRAYLSLASTCIFFTPGLCAGFRRRHFLVARVHLEGARRGELAELVADHVFRHQHRHVLTPVVDGNREPHHVGHDHRTPRP